MSTESRLLDFLARFAPASNGELDGILEDAKSFELELRGLFANQPEHATLRNPLTGLLSLFDIPDYRHVLRARPRLIQQSLPEEEGERALSEHFIFPLPETKRYSEGQPITVESFDVFLRCWNVFSEETLSQINWDNVVVAGGSILACVSPIPVESMSSKVALREYFQRKEYISSDIDLFLYGLSHSEVPCSSQ